MKNQSSLFLKTNAYFSDCRKYRYALERVWDEKLWNNTNEFAMFIGLNPSTADEINNDPTITRCISFAKDWGCGGLCMMNLFAFRATDPKEMRQAKNPIGPDNDLWIKGYAQRSRIIVAAWGCHGTFMGRDKEVIEMIPDLHYLTLTKDGHPGHPLYLKKDLKPKRWQDFPGG